MLTSPPSFMEVTGSRRANLPWTTATTVPSLWCHEDGPVILVGLHNGEIFPREAAKVTANADLTVTTGAPRKSHVACLPAWECSGMLVLTQWAFRQPGGCLGRPVANSH